MADCKLEVYKGPLRRSKGGGLIVNATLLMPSWAKPVWCSKRRPVLGSFERGHQCPKRHKSVSVAKFSPLRFRIWSAPTRSNTARIRIPSMSRPPTRSVWSGVCGRFSSYGWRLADGVVPTAGRKREGVAISRLPGKKRDQLGYRGGGARGRHRQADEPIEGRKIKGDAVTAKELASLSYLNRDIFTGNNGQFGCN